MGDTLKCKRGMVFWIDDKNDKEKTENTVIINGRECHSSIMAGTRPWLVVSCDDSNLNSTCCNVIPVTSAKVDNAGYHVYFYSHTNIRYTILPEQMKTVDAFSLGGYLYTLSEKTMEKVELAMLSQFGIRQRLSCTEETLAEVVDLIEPTIKKIMMEKANINSKIISSRNIEDIAIKISQNIEELFSTYQEPEYLESNKQDSKKEVPAWKNETMENFTGELIVDEEIQQQAEQEELQEEQQEELQEEQQEELQEEYEEQQEEQEEQQGAQQTGQQKKPKIEKQEKIKQQADNKPAKKDKVIKSETKKNGLRKWTYEMKLEFLDDCEKMSIPDIMRKWDMPNKGSYYTFKYQIKKEIREMTEMKKSKVV